MKRTVMQREKKGQQRLHCTRKLISFNGDGTIMTMFYQSFIKRIMPFCLVSWFCQASLKQKQNPTRLQNGQVA